MLNPSSLVLPFLRKNYQRYGFYARYTTPGNNSEFSLIKLSFVSFPRRFRRWRWTEGADAGCGRSGCIVTLVAVSVICAYKWDTRKTTTNKLLITFKQKKTTKKKKNDLAGGRSGWDMRRRWGGNGVERRRKDEVGRGIFSDCVTRNTHVWLLQQTNKKWNKKMFKDKDRSKNH